MQKKKINLVMSLVFLAIAPAAFAQLAADFQDPYLSSFAVVDSKQSQIRVDRPENLKSLSNFVHVKFPDAYLLQETTVDGQASITFRQNVNEVVTDSLLIDRGDHLEINQDTLVVTAKAVETADEEGMGPDLPTGNCGGVPRSPGNPYPCCDPNNAQNCTYYAWEMAYRFWGDSLPGISGNAKNWYTLANYGYPVAPTSGAGLYMIPVSSTLSTYGHVCFSMEIADNMVLCREQNCGVTTQGFSQRWRSIATYNKGFVQTKRNLAAPYINRNVPSPPRVNTSSDQWVTFYGGNFNAGGRAVVIFPSGGRATLKDGQLQPSGTSFRALMRLGASGTWRIQWFNENGKFSSVYSFTVSP